MVEFSLNKKVPVQYEHSDLLIVDGAFFLPGEDLC
jgi:hypothetical protein